MCGVRLPDGLTEASRLPEPIFTPATKAAIGDHDENVSFEEVAAQLGADRAAELRDVTLRVYRQAAEHARGRGVILADTKFEFGLAADGSLVLGDEVLTPDSSRYWPTDGYEPGKVQPSFDKQFVRNWSDLGGLRLGPRVGLPAAPAAGRDRRRHARPLRRGLRTDHRPRLRRLAYPHAVSVS